MVKKLECKEQHKNFPPFTIFVNFVSEEAKIAADHVSSINAVMGHQSQKTIKTMTKSVRTLSTTLTSKDSSEQIVQKPESESSMSCIVCQQRHQLTDSGKTLGGRYCIRQDKRNVFSNWLFAHLSRNCKTRNTCNECAKDILKLCMVC